jgi:hypothetical protein
MINVTYDYLYVCKPTIRPIGDTKEIMPSGIMIGIECDTDAEFNLIKE